MVDLVPTASMIALVLTVALIWIKQSRPGKGQCRFLPGADSLSRALA